MSFATILQQLQEFEACMLKLWRASIFGGGVLNKLEEESQVVVFLSGVDIYIIYITVGIHNLCCRKRRAAQPPPEPVPVISGSVSASACSPELQLHFLKVLRLGLRQETQRAHPSCLQKHKVQFSQRSSASRVSPCSVSRIHPSGRLPPPQPTFIFIFYFSRRKKKSLFD